MEQPIRGYGPRFPRSAAAGDVLHLGDLFIQVGQVRASIETVHYFSNVAVEPQPLRQLTIADRGETTPAMRIA
jgi:hypothetical protein